MNPLLKETNFFDLISNIAICVATVAVVKLVLGFLATIFVM